MKTIEVKTAEKFQGVITVPGDKSISHRAAILGSLTDGVVSVTGFLQSGDCLNTLRAMRSMGVVIERFGEKDIKIYGVGLNGLKKPNGVLDLGNSGTGVRLLSGLVSGYSFETEITGDESIRRRPMQRIIKPLKEMGARIEGERCPLRITGGSLKKIDYISPVSSAQVKSCILIAGLFADGATSVTEPFKSRDHTERMLKYLGADTEEEENKVSIKGRPVLKAKPLNIPGDFSSAAFFITGGLITRLGDITIKNVGLNPTRIHFLRVLERMAADVKVEQTHVFQGEPVGNITVKSSQMRGTLVTKEEVPELIDELPIISVLMSFAFGKSEVEGAEELRVKECDRIKAMAVNLKKMGVDIIEKNDGWIINGGFPLNGAKVESFSDHRVAMSMIIAGLAAKGETLVKDTEWIDTSFPGFMDIINALIK